MKFQPLEVICAFLGLVSFVFHLIATVFPYWWTVHEKENNGHEQHLTFYYGIWAVVDCRNGSCITRISRMHGKRVWLIGPAVLFVLADVLLLTVLIISCICLFCNTMHIVLRKISVLFSGGAGGVIALAVLIFYKKKAGLRPYKAPETTNGDPGWALYISASAAVISLCNALLIGSNIRRVIHAQKRKDKIFGIRATDMEINVNALRKDILVQGPDVTRNYNESAMQDYDNNIDKQLPINDSKF